MEFFFSLANFFRTFPQSIIAEFFRSRENKLLTFAGRAFILFSLPLTGRVYFVLMHETVYLELSGTHHILENSADHQCIIILHHQDAVVIQTQAKSTEKSKLHMPLFGEFGRSSPDLCHYGG